MTSTQYILALDIGTSSVRAALYDFEGNVLPESFVKRERFLNATDDGGAEIDAEEAFQQVVRLIDDVLERTKNIDGEIEYVAACAFWHSLVGVDGRGEPTTSVFGWADTRSRDFVKELRAELDESQVHNRTGARFHSSYWTAKLLWLRSAQREVFEKTEKWLSLSDLFARRLFGEAATGISMASGTGIFDLRKCQWDESLFHFFRIEQQNLPRIAGSEETFRLNAKYRKRWARLKNAEWFPAIGDGAANNVGAGCLEKSRAALMVGTSAALRVAYEGAPPAKIPGGLWCYRIDGKRVIVGGALSDGGGLYAWLKENLKLTGTDDEIEREISRREPAAHSLTFLPFLAGERGTGYNEQARGAVLGLKTATDSIDVVQAALESIAYRLAEIFDELNGILKIKEITASGGALRESPVWTQIIADVLGQNLFLPAAEEASLRGAVLLALETIGKIESIADWETPKEREFRFDEKRNAIYRQGRERHKEFYKLLID